MIPFLVIYRFWVLFCERYADQSSVDPPSWKVINYVGIPKDVKTRGFADFRWIGLLDACLKWYLHSITPHIRPSLRDARVATFGFRAGFSCDDIVGVLKQTLFLAQRWNMPAIIGSMDIEIAFDSMDHSRQSTSLADRGAHPCLNRAILREVSFMKCSMALPGMAPCERFNLH